MNNKKRVKIILVLISLTINIIVIGYFVTIELAQYNQWKKIFSRDHLIVDKNIIHADQTAIILTFGQSNAASSGQGSYRCRNNVFEYYKGKLYKAEEPLMGAPENYGCSVWTRFSDMLIDSGLYKNVIIIPIAIGSTTVECWSEGICNQKLIETLKYIKKDNIKITHIYFHQGESDNLEKTSKNEYKKRLKKIEKQLRSNGLDAVFYVCIASYHPNITNNCNGLNYEIQKAQIEFASENMGTKNGPNTDSLNLVSDRYDGVHFSKRGLDKFAKLLFKNFKEQ